MTQQYFMYHREEGRGGADWCPVEYGSVDWSSLVYQKVSGLIPLGHIPMLLIQSLVWVREGDN